MKEPWLIVSNLPNVFEKSEKKFISDLKILFRVATKTIEQPKKEYELKRI